MAKVNTKTRPNNTRHLMILLWCVTVQTWLHSASLCWLVVVSVPVLLVLVPLIFTRYIYIAEQFIAFQASGNNTKCLFDIQLEYRNGKDVIKFNEKY